MGMVADGASNRAIAQQLLIKENTVKKSLMRIYDKLGLSNRVELVLYALTHRGVDQTAASGCHLRLQSHSRWAPSIWAQKLSVGRSFESELIRGSLQIEAGHWIATMNCDLGVAAFGAHHAQNRHAEVHCLLGFCKGRAPLVLRTLTIENMELSA